MHPNCCSRHSDLTGLLQRGEKEGRDGMGWERDRESESGRRGIRLREGTSALAIPIPKKSSFRFLGCFYEVPRWDGKCWRGCVYTKASSAHSTGKSTNGSLPIPLNQMNRFLCRNRGLRFLFSRNCSSTRRNRKNRKAPLPNGNWHERAELGCGRRRDRDRKQGRIVFLPSVYLIEAKTSKC